jgi:hypothetical protein
MNGNVRNVLLITILLLVVSSSALALCPKDERFTEFFTTFKDSQTGFPPVWNTPFNRKLGATGSIGSSKELSTRIRANSLYSPIICRPPEHYGLEYSGRCTNELYPQQTSPYGKGEMAKPCKPSIEAKYYAQRPIINPNSYEKMLNELLLSIQEPVPGKYNIDDMTHPMEFCPNDCYTDVMKYIMKKINFAKKHLPVFKEFAKNDTWGGEQYAFWNEKVFVFTKHSESNLSQQERAEMARYNKNAGEARKYVVTFTLHNTTRSSSTDLVATVYEFENRKYITRIDFASRLHGDPNAPDGVSIPRAGVRHGSVNLNNNDLPVPEMPQWIFGNTVENKTFNANGFHDPDPSKNMLIPGGVPPEFEEYLETHEQAYLMKGGSAMRLPGGYDGNVVYPNLTPTGKDRTDKWVIKH